MITDIKIDNWVTRKQHSVILLKTDDKIEKCNKCKTLTGWLKPIQPPTLHVCPYINNIKYILDVGLQCYSGSLVYAFSVRWRCHKLKASCFMNTLQIILHIKQCLIVITFLMFLLVCSCVKVIYEYTRLPAMLRETNVTKSNPKLEIERGLIPLAYLCL